MMKISSVLSTPGSIRTAISGLSARTNSCGGDASLSGGGGDSGLEEVFFFGLLALVGLTLEKKRNIPPLFLSCKSPSSSDGGAERSEESDMAARCWKLSAVCDFAELEDDRCQN